MKNKQLHDKLIELSERQSEMDLLGEIIGAFHSIYEPGIVFIGILVDKERSLIEGRAAIKDGKAPKPWVYSAEGQPCGLVYEQGRVAIPCDIQRNFVKKAGTGRECFLGLPINNPVKGTIAHFAAYDNKPNHFDDLSVEVISLLNTLIEREFWKIRFQRSSRLEQLLDQMDLGLQYTDAQTAEVLRMNSVLEAKTGIHWSPEAHPKLEQFDTGAEIGVNATGEPVVEQRVGQFDTDYLQTDGSTLPVEVRSVRCDADTLMPEHYVALVTDISERIARINQLSESKAELQSALEKQKQFFAILGHELRTPVASMNMLLKDKVLPQNELDDYLSATTRNMLDVLEDLRFVIAPEERKRAEFKADYPGTLLTNLSGSLSALVQRQGMKLRTTSDSLGYQLALPTQILRQACTNLIKNAAVHSKGTLITLELEESKVSNTQVAVRIRIEDNGVGLPSGFAEKMFEPFTRGGSGADGTGLGLYIVKELCELAGVELRYEPLAGGTAFELTGTFSIVAQKPAGSAVEGKELQGMKVLLAEDNQMLQMLTQRLLSNLGAEVMLAENGQVAVDKLAHQSVDIVITDINMPIMDGYELVRSLKQSNFSGEIIGVSAAVQGSETDALIEAGASTVIPKPITATSLLGALNLA